MTNAQFFSKTAYQYKVKALERKLASFESGEIYTRMKEQCNKELAGQSDIIHKLRQKLTDANKKLAASDKQWSEIVKDTAKACEKNLDAKDREIKALKERILIVERQRDAALDNVTSKQHEINDLRGELNDANEIIAKLTAQVNKDFENSSIPSSMQGPGRKKIPNSREKSTRKPGAQIGHTGAKRKKQDATDKIYLPAPDKVLNNPEYYKTGKFKTKQVVGIAVSLTVTEYIAEEYRNRNTGARVYAEFPAGVTDDVNYDGTVRAFLCMLNTECNVSIDKAAKFLKELSSGRLEISKGMISKLNAEFSEKTKEERDEIVRKLMSTAVMHADFTNANVNGSSKQVFIVSDPTGSNSLYIAREVKGHEGIKGTPLEHYVGTAVHDHDTTFYKYGLKHQECMQHNLRYVKGSMENEQHLTWNKQMHELMQRMLHYKNSLDGEEPDPEKTEALEKEYDRILALANEEYTKTPPSKYYREGYNLYLRLKEYKESELLFLHDKNVPSNNSVCERLARVYKRKQKQAMALRSYKSFEYLCDSLSMMHKLRTEDEENVMNMVAEVFNRPTPEKRQGKRFKKESEADKETDE